MRVSKAGMTDHMMIDDHHLVCRLENYRFTRTHEFFVLKHKVFVEIV